MTTVVTAAASGAADICLTRLPQPAPPPDDTPWVAQSLTRGAAGIALAHIQRAHHRLGSWRTAHTWITRACTGQVSASRNTGLFHGLPAIAFVLSTTAGRYQGGLADALDPLSQLAHRRATDAHAHITAGGLPGFGDYDIFFGLTGVAALLLRVDPAGSALEHILTALVALTRPQRVDGTWLPGWWVDHDPHRRQSDAFPGGHANLGMAHGIAGPLALLALTSQAGRTVSGQHEAIATILEFLDDWRQDGPRSPWWPQWISRTDLATGRPSQPGPGRPSWCYGTPGIARAGQLAGLATDDTSARQVYEDALDACLTDSAQHDLITGPGLCHGAAGLYQTVWRAARDAATSALTDHLPDLAHRLAEVASAPHEDGPGFLDGDAGTLLALHTTSLTASGINASDTSPDSGWDACLLLS